LANVEEVFSVGINRAVVLLAERQAGGGKGRFQRAAPTLVKDLGEHPAGGGKLEVLSGRYGPYVRHGDVNATLPRGSDPASLSLEDAVRLIAERIAKGPPSRPKRRRAANGKAAKGALAGNRSGEEPTDGVSPAPPPGTRARKGRTKAGKGKKASKPRPAGAREAAE
jgi:DNA topoisomerase-1